MLKTLFVCTKCDAQFPKWSGRCLQCGAWGTVKEATLAEVKDTPTVTVNHTHLLKLTDLKGEATARLKTNLAELDNVLGGGLVPGSLVLLGGEPGIGKSTLALQIFKSLPSDKPLLYVSGEESPEQIKLRADRLGCHSPALTFFNDTNLEQIIAAIKELQPQIVVIDSIQTVYTNEVNSEPGSLSQIRACTVKLLQSAKETKIPIIITGHVTKDGDVAGPKTLEHLVDVVIYFEGDKYHGFRVLRGTKNRFGSTNELGIFEMTGAGLEEVKNPAAAFIEQSTIETPGTAISCFVEGSRAFLVEIQALVTPTVFGYPQRKTSGYDTNRLQMLAAVLTKRVGLNLTNQDIHLNVVGGHKVTEPAIDLAVSAAIISAMKNIPLPDKALIIGEVGLGGEVRPVYNIDIRLKEASKLNFTTAIIPDMKAAPTPSLKITKIRHLSDLPFLSRK